MQIYENILYQESIVEIKHFIPYDEKHTLSPVFVFCWNSLCHWSLIPQTMKVVTVVADNMSTGKSNQ